MTTYTADRKGHVTENDSFQDRFLEKMYGSAIGRALLKPLVNPVLSEIGGRILDSQSICTGGSGIYKTCRN